MISLIICSKFPILEEELVANITQTIGSDFEIINIDNSKGQYNIFEAYNIGVKRAKGEYLCFMHEDIRFHSYNWGKVVEAHLSHSVVGAIGVAGGNVVANQLDWRFYGFGHVNLIQGSWTIEENPHYYISYSPQKKSGFPPMALVAVLDGAWICIRKELFNSIHFDTENFHDFHLYDSDICMQINRLGKGVFITYDVLIEHMSEGTFSEGYVKSLDIFFKKWENELPLVKGAIVANDEIEQALCVAQKRFDERIKSDALLIGLRKIFAKKKKQEPCRDYTAKEKEIMDSSAYEYRRRCIHNKEMSFSQVKKLVKEYIQMPFARKKHKLFIKFVWYRVMKP